MKTELQEFIEVCESGNIGLYMPTTDQLLEMLGDKFNKLRRIQDGNYTVDGISNHYPIITIGQSARIALARAVKEVLNG